MKKDNCRFCCWLLLALLFIALSPFVFTRPAFCKALVFTESGQIGDTIGGLTAPVIGFVSIILLYLTLKEQINFNKHLKRDGVINQLTTLQYEILQISSQITFYYNEGKNCNLLAEGFSSLGTLSQSGTNGHEYSLKLDQAKSVLIDIEVLIDLCAMYHDLTQNKKEDFAKKYNAFPIKYMTAASLFLTAIFDNNIKLVSNTFEIHSLDSQKSESDIIRDKAKELYNSIKAQNHDV